MLMNGLCADCERYIDEHEGDLSNESEESTVEGDQSSAAGTEDGEEHVGGTGRG